MARLFAASVCLIGAVLASEGCSSNGCDVEVEESLSDVTLLQTSTKWNCHGPLCGRPRAEASQSDQALFGLPPSQELLPGAEASHPDRPLMSLKRQELLPGSETLSDVVKSFLETLQICGTCKGLTRLGEASDGGYITCMDGMNSTVAALSMGVEHHDMWSNHVQGRFNIPVAQFDCTVDEGADCHTSRCQFFKTCIVSATNVEESSMTPRATMAEALKMAGVHEAAERSLLLKMDIEGAEWPVLANEPLGTLRKFNQIILELHQVGDATKMSVYDQAMRKLLAAGFRVVHVHGNNHEGLFNPAKDVIVPDTLEITFSSHATKKPQCLHVQEYIRGLDAPNADSTELPLMRLP